MDLKLRYGSNTVSVAKNNQKKELDKISNMVGQGEITPAKALHMLKSDGGKRRATSNTPRSDKKQEEPIQTRSGIDEVLKELDRLVGLKIVKKLIFELRAFISIQQRRIDMNLRAEPLVLHMVFRGNPGTGKTTVARIVGELFRELKVLPKGHIIEVERADLVGEYIGHTAQKTKEQVKHAQGGVLFIDEAYSLARGGEKDFGKEAIDVLVKAMEDHKDSFILILAGYKDEMDWFLMTNPGLRSRFPVHIDFPDYTVDELLDIAMLMIKQREYSLSADAKGELRKLVEQKILHGHQHSGNARLVRNIIEKAIRCQAVRLVTKKQLSREELMTIRTSDIKEAVKSGN